jgi:hypothetical protein
MRVFLVATAGYMQRATAGCLGADPLCEITVVHGRLFYVRSNRLYTAILHSFPGVTHAIEVTGREDILALYTFAR